MRILPVTSERAVSLRRVTEDVADVLREQGHTVLEPMLYPDAVQFQQLRFQATYIVMTFDTIWATPFFYLGYRAKADGKRYVFYATVEGRIQRTSHDDWVFRELEFTAVSNYVAGKLMEAGARVRGVVYHGVDTEEAYICSGWGPKIRETLGLSKDDFLVGYVAGAYTRKGHDVFAEVIKLTAKRDPTIKFAVLTQPQAQQFYADCPNTIVLTSFGDKDRKWMYGFYGALDLYAHPALAEGFGLPVLEALACGRAVVHADYEPLSEITTKETSFRVPVASVEYAQDAMHLATGILYEHHLYDPQDFADAIIQAKDEVQRRRDELYRLCIQRARDFSKRKVYSAIARMLTR
jgi:glycosyltransferase involved in cell wall biosynthesis